MIIRCIFFAPMARSTKSRAFGKKVKRAFAPLLTEYRQNADLSQEELAGKAGLGRKHYHLLEKGRSLPGLDTLLRLMHAVGNDAVEVLTRLMPLVFGLGPSSTQPLPVLSTEQTPLAMDKCRRCQAIYTLHAGRVPFRDRHKFKCVFCKRELATWSGTTAFTYRVHTPPPKG
jgi:transcriptional regulator with XRE-family HTH domain